jgi:FADH2 O2-dependent halogenase
MKQRYDVVILGSGIAGSILALVLGRVGVNTLVVEKDSHPRFAIGESTLPTTTFLLRRFATRYNIPELADICSYEGLRKHGCAAWPKQIFWFGVHQQDRPLETRHECINEALLAPLGPDVHMVRADVDSFLVSLLEEYGVDFVDRSCMKRFDARPDYARLEIETAEGIQEVRTELVVDATGHASQLCRELNLRDDEPSLHTNTRSVFGHFSGVPDLDTELKTKNPNMRFRRSAGTQHHCFEGGWFWVIPFDNNVTSVGLELDRRRYPRDPALSPQEELASFIQRFPSVQAHLGAMEPVRPLVATDRIQFTSRSIVSERFIATPHAAAFVEPLFSTGIMLTLSFIDRFAHAAGNALKTKDWSTGQFAFIEKLFFDEIRQIDLLVDGTIQSFRNFDLFKQYWRAWVIGTFVQYGCCILQDGATVDRPMLYGAGIPGFVRDLQRMHELVNSVDTPPAALAASVKRLMDPWWDRLIASVTQSNGDFALDSAEPLNVMANPLSAQAIGLFFNTLIDDYEFRDVQDKLSNLSAWIAREKTNWHKYASDYVHSQVVNSEHHRSIDVILKQALPGTLDYQAQVLLHA